MTQPLRYSTAAALDRAIKDRLTAAVANTPYDLSELRRQFGYDRLLARIFAADSDAWILKGGGGLLARIPGHARHSIDVDLYYQGELDNAVTQLQTLGEDDTFGDYFTFDIARRPGEIGTGTNGISLTVVAYLGEREFLRFSIDLVIASNMTQQPDTISPLALVTIDGLPYADYRVYSLVDHIADKHAAMIDTYRGKPSSRYRDLVDLVIIATTQSVDAETLRTALLSEYAHRRLDPPTSVVLPAPTWTDGYAREAAKVANLSQQTATEGLAVVQALLEPVLNGDATGGWDPATLRWLKDLASATTRIDGEL